ncbi:MAG: 2-phospho-L-lactate guanylyltransferase [Acidimicrobiales bacterium]
MKAAVVIPVKAFTEAKLRLAPVLSPEERHRLAKEMATRVLRACKPLPAVVVCNDTEVAEWASGLGARALPEPELGLNGAVSAAVLELAGEGYERLVIAHSDLPLATSFTWLAELEGIVLVPDRRADGTNVISIPANTGFRFSYGPGSFARHYQEALRTGLKLRAVHDPDLSWDVDTVEDMQILRKAKNSEALRNPWPQNYSEGKALRVGFSGTR